MRRIFWNDLSANELTLALRRPQRRVDPAISATVEKILGDIEKTGADAVNDWAKRLDGHPVRELTVSSALVDKARSLLARENLAALDLAVENIRRYHLATKPADIVVDFEFGLQCRRLFRPISACGLYAPGGSAPLFSTLLMLALPAQAAGVKSRIAVTPPMRDGEAHPMMIAAAGAAGLDHLTLVGGAQAIGALAFGAVTPRAEKIFGPGNAYVAEAKRQVAAKGLAAIDLPAGPSELMIIADEAAEAAVVAADLLGQAEHDADAQVVLVTDCEAFADLVISEIARQLQNLPRRAIASAALEQSRALIVPDIDAAIAAANAYAPEHLSINAQDADEIARKIDNAGAIFVGRGSAEAFGDYINGPSHVLPTDGAARAYSGVTTGSFMKSVSVQRLTGAGAAFLSEATARLARLEGLEAHARSAELRR